MARFEGKVALVTGAASGIGAAAADLLRREGAVVAGIDLAPPAAWPGAGTLHAGDVRDEAAVAAAVEATVAEHGRLDILVTAAGVGGGGPIHLLEQESWERTLGINLTGTFLACKHALRAMLPRRSGAIVTIASVEGLEGLEGASSYNASKGGVVLLTKGIAIDYARSGIRANAVCPGFTETPLLRSVFDNEVTGPIEDRYRDAHHLGRFGTAEEIAHVIAFLASDEASFVTGHAMVADGGFLAGRRFGVLPAFGLT